MQFSVSVWPWTHANKLAIFYLFYVFNLPVFLLFTCFVFLVVSLPCSAIRVISYKFCGLIEH